MIPLLPGPEFLAHIPDLLGENQEFAALRPITPETVAEVCRRGFMPMGLGGERPDILLVKCHRQRMVLDFGDLHVPRNVPRYAQGLTVHVDRQFSTVLAHLDRSHEESWISPALARAFCALHERSIAGVTLHAVTVHDPDASEDAPPVAGEIGYTVGRVYTSLSGYHTRNGSGWVQMVALGRLLEGRGAAFWDLGMDIPYKRRLGARPVQRDDFLARYRSAATVPPTAAGESRLDEPLLQVAGPWWARELVSRSS